MAVAGPWTIFFLTRMAFQLWSRSSDRPIPDFGAKSLAKCLSMQQIASLIGQWRVFRPTLRLHAPLKGNRLLTRSASSWGRSSGEAEFWLRVKTNLEAGRIRLLFVADAIPSELRRIIEFLNKQMNPAEVLGVELRQFEGQGLRTLVPLVVGQTQEATQKRNPSGGQDRQWDEASILSEIKSRFSEPEFDVARRVANWMKSSGGRLWFGKGQSSGSMGVTLTSKDRVEFYPIILWTYGRIEIQFQWMKGRPFFDEIENRRELMRRLNQIGGVNISEENLTKRPSVPLSVLSSSPAKTEQFLDTLNWTVERYHSG